MWKAVMLMTVAAIMVVWRHRSNIVRLLEGRENRVRLRTHRPPST